MNIVGGVKLNCKVDNRTLLHKNDYFIDRDLYFEMLNLMWSVAMYFMLDIACNLCPMFYNAVLFEEI